jgi:hypothetical protein
MDRKGAGGRTASGHGGRRCLGAGRCAKRRVTVQRAHGCRLDQVSWTIGPRGRTGRIASPAWWRILALLVWTPPE